MDNKIREEFEEWFKGVEAGDDINWKEPEYQSTEYTEYLNRRTLAWGAWQASRKAIVIESPLIVATVFDGDSENDKLLKLAVTNAVNMVLDEYCELLTDCEITVIRGD